MATGKTYRTSGARSAGGVLRLRRVAHDSVDDHHADARQVAQPDAVQQVPPRRVLASMITQSAARPGSISPPDRPWMRAVLPVKQNATRRHLAEARQHGDHAQHAERLRRIRPAGRCRG